MLFVHLNGMNVILIRLELIKGYWCRHGKLSIVSGGGGGVVRGIVCNRQ